MPKREPLIMKTHVFIYGGNYNVEYTQQRALITNPEPL